MGLELPEGVDGNSKVKGLPTYIDPSKQPKSYKQAMRLSNKELWLEQQGVPGFCPKWNFGMLKIEHPPPGAKILGNTTWT